MISLGEARPDARGLIDPEMGRRPLPLLAEPSPVLGAHMGTRVATCQPEAESRGPFVPRPVTPHLRGQDSVGAPDESQVTDLRKLEGHTLQRWVGLSPRSGLAVSLKFCSVSPGHMEHMQGSSTINTNIYIYILFYPCIKKIGSHCI